MPSTCHDAPPGAAESVTFPCNFAEGRAASRRLCDFLARQGVSQTDLFACELALTEACNNAVQHVGAAGSSQPITARAACNASEIELTVIDHTDGFDWPSTPLEAPPPEAEHGRGIFIIRSIMRRAEYVAGTGQNTLTMWRPRSAE